jgi:IclR family transcriptional regulator, pca regulon regulatory protein
LDVKIERVCKGHNVVDKREDGDFVESFARGLKVIRAFSTSKLAFTVSDMATATELARPTARRLLLTLEQLGYVRSHDGLYMLTPQILDLGMSYITAQGMWDIARPHLESLVSRTKESSSMSQLDGSDIVYTARVSVPKIIGISVQIGTRFPAIATSMGHVLVSELSSKQLDEVLATPSQSRVVPRIKPSRKELNVTLAEVRSRGWAISDERLSLGIRSIAVPVRNSSGGIIAAVNVTVNAAETPLAKLRSSHLPLLLETAQRITDDFVRISHVPAIEVEPS